MAEGPHSKWSTRLFISSTRKPSSHAGLSQFKKVNILLFCPVVLSSVFFRISGLTYGELSEWSKVQHSKSCGELSVSSTKNLVAMRVLPGSKIE